jgi:ABC-type glycerol-3-phosphate transport system permease component
MHEVEIGKISYPGIRVLSDSGPHLIGVRSPGRDAGERSFGFPHTQIEDPIEETFRLSFMKSTGLGDAVFTGLDNYVKLLRDEQFQAGLLHVFAWAFFSVIVQVPLAFLVAFYLIAYRNKVTRSLRAVYYLASILPSAVTSFCQWRPSGFPSGP